MGPLVFDQQHERRLARRQAVLHVLQVADPETEGVVGDRLYSQCRAKRLTLFVATGHQAKQPANQRAQRLALETCQVTLAN